MAILVFNLEKEAWSVMALPKEAMPISWHVELREIQGLVSSSYCVPDKGIEIWMLRDYANRVWSKDFVIDVTLLGARMNFVVSVFFLFPLEMMADGRILLRMNNSNDHQWFYFDPRDGSSQLVDHKGFSTTI